MIEIDGLRDTRDLVQVAHVAPEIREIDQSAQVALEVPVIDRVEPQQRGRSDRRAADQQLLDFGAHKGHVRRHLAADGHGPISQLVPGQEVSAEITAQSDNSQNHAYYPAQGSIPQV